MFGLVSLTQACINKVIYLTDGATMGLSDALEGIVPFIQKGFSFMTQEPMIYFIAVGLVGSAIGLFGLAKNVSH